MEKIKKWGKEMEENKEKEILTIEEAADYLNIQKRTLYKLAREGKIPAVKIGGQWRFSKTRLMEIFFAESKKGENVN